VKGEKDAPMSPATSESRPLKMIPQSVNSSGRHSFTTRSLTADGMGSGCFHLAILEYGFPADLAEAPNVWTTNLFAFLMRHLLHATYTR